MTALIRIFISIFLAVVLFTTDFGMGINGKKENKAQAEDTVDEAVSEQSDEEKSAANTGFLSNIVDQISNNSDEANVEKSLDINELLALEDDNKKIEYIRNFCANDLTVTSQEVAVISEDEFYNGDGKKCTNPDYFGVRESYGGVLISSYSGPDSEEYVVIPNKIEGKNVLGMEMGLFRDRTHIKGIALPEACFQIGHTAFEGCSRLKTVKSSPYVTSIEYEAFGDCISLESFETVPLMSDTEQVFLIQSVGMDAFVGCATLKYIALDNLQGYRNIYNLVMVGGMRRLPELERIILPFGTACQVNRLAAADCPKLQEVINTEGIVEIKDTAFQGCESLKSMLLPCVRHIEGSAFNKCTSLKTAVIPASTNQIGYSTYNECTSLEYVLFDKEGVDENGKEENYLNLFLEANAETGEYNEDEIKNRYNMWDFSKIFLKGDDGAVIDNYAFYASKIHSVRIPDRFYNIGFVAFWKNDNLEYFYWEGTDLPAPVQVMNDIFRDCTNMKEIRLPETLLSVVDENGLKQTLKANPDCIIKVAAGSNAEQICIDNEIPYETE